MSSAHPFSIRSDGEEHLETKCLPEEPHLGSPVGPAVASPSSPSHSHQHMVLSLSQSTNEANMAGSPHLHHQKSQQEQHQQQSTQNHTTTITTTTGNTNTNTSNAVLKRSPDERTPPSSAVPSPAAAPLSGTSPQLAAMAIAKQQQRSGSVFAARYASSSSDVGALATPVHRDLTASERGRRQQRRGTTASSSSNNHNLAMINSGVPITTINGRQQPVRADSRAYTAPLSMITTTEVPVGDRASATREHDDGRGTDRTHSNKIFGGEETNDSAMSGRLSMKLRSSMSLAFVLVLQCLSVAGAFVVLIVVTSLMMDSTARALVEEGVAAELHYARARILAPINMYEKLLLSVRHNYIATKLATGDEPCSERTETFDDSSSFFIDSTSIIENNPMLSFVYHLRRSELRNYSNTSEPHMVECDATPSSIIMIKGANYYSDRRPSMTDFANLSAALEVTSDDADYFVQDYVWQALSFSTFYWLPYIYYDTLYETADLLVAAHAPMTLKRTYTDGSTDTYTPVLAISGDGVTAGEDVGNETTTPSPAPGKTIVSTEVLSTIALEVSMSAFATLMRSVTPDDAGATTSLYDLSPDRARPSLVCTSVEGMRVFDSATEQEWPAGQTPSEAINRAYRIARPTPTRAASSSGTVVTLSEDFAKGDIVARIAYEDGYVVSTIPIETSSGITFAVVQATPEAYYLSTVWQLRTVMIAIGVVAAVFVVVVCVAIGVSIVVPLRKMQANMQLASSFKNEHVVPTSSFLSEIDLLCLSLDRMNAKLLQARAFMPQALLTSSGEDEEGDVDEEANGSGDEYALDVVDLFDDDHDSHVTGGSHPPHKACRGVSPSGVHGGNTTDTSDTHTRHSGRGSALRRVRRAGDAKHAAVPVLKRPPVDGGVTELAAVGSSNASMVNKRVTVLAVNARGFHAKVSLSAPSTITAIAADLTGLVVSVCAAERGVVDAFHGDHFVLTFNAAKHNAQGPVKAVRAALAIASSASALAAARSGGHAATQADSSFSHHHRLSPNALLGGSGVHDGSMSTHDTTLLLGKHGAASTNEPFVSHFSMGASTGRACVGHLGTASMKRQSVVGKCYSKAMALERLCRRIGSLAGTDDGSPPIQCLTDGPLATEVKHLYLLQLLGALCHAPFVDSSSSAQSPDNCNGRGKGMERLYAVRDVIGPNSNAFTASTAAAHPFVPLAASYSLPMTKASLSSETAVVPTDPNAVSTLVNLGVFESTIRSIIGGGAVDGRKEGDCSIRNKNDAAADCGLGINDGEWLYETQRAAQQDPLLVNINECYGAYLKELMQIRQQQQEPRRASDVATQVSGVVCDDVLRKSEALRQSFIASLALLEAHFGHIAADGVEFLGPANSTVENPLGMGSSNTNALPDAAIINFMRQPTLRTSNSNQYGLDGINTTNTTNVNKKASVDSAGAGLFWGRVALNHAKRTIVFPIPRDQMIDSVTFE